MSPLEFVTRIKGALGMEPVEIPSNEVLRKRIDDIGEGKNLLTPKERKDFTSALASLERQKNKINDELPTNFELSPKEEARTGPVYSQITHLKGLLEVDAAKKNILK